MSIDHIRESVGKVAEYFSAHPDEALSADRPAVAIVEDGLRCSATGPNGATLVSDMPKALGGGGSAPTPGWFLRAALANCDATVIAMRAAQLGIALSKLEVAVGSHSDNRGLLGVPDDIAAGPLSVHVSVRIAAPGVSADRLRELVDWAEMHSPVGDAIRRAIPCALDVQVE
ncbi:MAG TPA: OsmC family protein [Casimicrobiaceae bacterium]|nr:OsmC family protein [Casimicrobiaceae bacterium]